jgi:hypothetical protein
MEAAAAAGVPLTIPTTLITNTNTNNTLTTTNTSILSSSLPLLLFNQSTNDHYKERSLTTIFNSPYPNILDPSEWPPLQAPLKPPTLTCSEPDSPQPTLLPSIVKQKSQVYIKHIKNSINKLSLRFRFHHWLNVHHHHHHHQTLFHLHLLNPFIIHFVKLYLNHQFYPVIVATFNFR